MTATVAELVENARVVVTAGSGGVGKTSVAAVLGMEAAKAGRSVVVVTIDPARRLADALGLTAALDAIGDGAIATTTERPADAASAPDGEAASVSVTAAVTATPTLVEGDWSGELSVVMLDAKSTFDSLVHAGAGDDAQADRIIANPIYRSISGALSGTQEYMASEKLHQLASDGRWDLVVVDTPPTRNALDFLTAPDRLLRFFDHRLYKLLTAPSRGVFKVANVAAQTFLRTVSRLVGAEVIEDVIEFFNAFEGMEAGFRERAQAVDDLLRADDTAFVLVASPRRDTVAEARYFAEHLSDLGIEVNAAIVNRMTPRHLVANAKVGKWLTQLDVDLDAIGRPDVSEAGAASSRGSKASKARGAGSKSAGSKAASVDESAPFVALASNLFELTRAAELEDEHLGGLREVVGDAPVVLVPQLEREVCDMDGLAELGRWVLA